MTVIVEVPVKFVTGVSVSVESSTEAAIWLVEEVAEKVIAWVKEESVANSDTVFATF